MPLPSVAGTLVKDIDPSTFGLADGTAITFANSGLTPVAANPTYRTNVFDSGAAAVRVVQGSSGFSVPRPVQDDFSIYVAIFNATAQAPFDPTAWWTCGALVDGEVDGSNLDFGINLRNDGKLCAGVGGTSGVGTHPISDGLPHIIQATRVKATGAFKVWVDGALDISITGSTASLTAPTNLNFGWGSYSTSRLGGYYGRALFYDAAHSDSDRGLVQAYLESQYADGAYLRATKAIGYAALGTIPDVITAAKAVSYAPTGPGQAGDVGATKAISYGATGPGYPGTLACTKAVTYAVLGPGGVSTQRITVALVCRARQAA